MYNNPNRLNLGWCWSSFIFLSDLLVLWNLQGLVIQLANMIPAALKGRKLVAMRDFGLSIPHVPTNPWIPPTILLSDVVHQQQHRSRFSNFTCESVTLNSRWQLESPKLNWTAADFMRQQQTLEMQGCQWYQECEETMKSSTTSMQASLPNKMSFRWTVFCSVDKWKCTTAVSDFDCHFLVFLLLSSEQIRWRFVLWAIFWHHIAFVCWAGTTICLPDEYIPFMDGMSCRYLGLIQTMCQLPMRKWQHTLTRQYNCMFQGGWISLIWGASHHTQGRDTHTVTSFTGMYVSSSHWNLEFEQSWLLIQKAPGNKIMIWAQSKLPRRSWFIIKLWNSLLWREGGGRHSNGDIPLQFTLWKVWVHAVGLPCTSWKWQFLTHCSILCRQVSWMLCLRFLFFSMVTRFWGMFFEIVRFTRLVAACCQNTA
jgi:hypothetical protein